MSAGIPIKLLHEAEGNNVAVELKNGEVYHGHLRMSEDNMNCHMTSVTMMARDGRKRDMEHVYIRGSQVRFIVLPKVLRDAPIFQRVQEMKEKKEKAPRHTGAWYQ